MKRAGHRVHHVTLAAIELFGDDQLGPSTVKAGLPAQTKITLYVNARSYQPVQEVEIVPHEHNSSGGTSTVERRPTETEPLTRADVLTATEASALLGIPRSTLYELARRQELPARQVCRRWIFRRSLLNRATLPQSEADTWRRPSA